jgi:hypothetical protein
MGAQLAAALLAAFGCGARAMVDASDEGGDGPRAGEGGAASDNFAGTGGIRANRAPAEPVGPIDLGGVALPACEPGFPPSSAGSRECTYMFRGQCYDERIEACACACVGLAVSNCISGGFLNLDEPQTVSCIAAR